jgi:hypothetical protein
MINLDTLFSSLGIVSGNAAAQNQYDFYKGIVWNDATITYDQYEFFEKLGVSRRDFFRTYAANEREFYRDIDDIRIYDFWTFYKHAAEYLDVNDWILKTGFWNDNFFWIDVATWND